MAQKKGSKPVTMKAAPGSVAAAMSKLPPGKFTLKTPLSPKAAAKALTKGKGK